MPFEKKESLLDRVLGKSRDKDVPEGQVHLKEPQKQPEKPKPEPKHAGTGRICQECGWYRGRCWGARQFRGASRLDEACAEFWDKSAKGTPLEMSDISRR